MINWGEFPNFSQHEFICPCCGVERMDIEFIREISRLRMALGFPIIVTSGYRCPEYNNKISSTGLTGPHTTGLAADVSVSFHRGREMISLAPQRFSGIGVKQHGDVSGRFMHLDLLEPRFWTYP